MKTSHKDMDLIMCYVLKVTGEPLGKKLAKEIKEDTVVISEMFPLGHLDEVKQIQSSIYGVPEKIFVYRKPKAKKENKGKDVKTSKVKKEVATNKKVDNKKAVSKASSKKVEAKAETKVASKPRAKKVKKA